MKSLPGVVDAFPILDHRAIVVVAKSTWQALQATRQLQTTQDPGASKNVDSDQVRNQFVGAVTQGGGIALLLGKDVSDRTSSAAHKISAGVSAQGISVWSQWVASQSVTASIATDLLGGLTPDKIKKNPILTVFGRVGSKVLNKLPIDPFKVEGAL